MEKLKPSFGNMIKKILIAFIVIVFLIIVIAPNDEERNAEFVELEKKALAISKEDWKANYLAYKELHEKNEQLRDNKKYDRDGRLKEKYEYYKIIYDSKTNLLNSCRASARQDTKKLLKNPTTYDTEGSAQRWQGDKVYYQAKFSGANAFNVRTNYTATYECVDTESNEFTIKRISFLEDR